MHVRSLATSGQTERGETLPTWSAPMRISAQDDLDLFYAQLADWVTYWAAVLDLNVPWLLTAAARVVAGGDVQGMRSALSPAGVWSLVNTLTGWLMTRFTAIDACDPAGMAFQIDMAGLVHWLQAKYGLTEYRERVVAPRPCPICGALAVFVEFYPTNSMPTPERRAVHAWEVEVKCDTCGFMAPIKSAKDVLPWLGED
jgi:hypothetical protein